MIEVGPPPKQPPASGAAAGGPSAAPARPAGNAVPVQLLQPAELPETLPANGTLAALVEPGSQAGIVGDLLQLSTEQGPLTIQSPVMLAAGTPVTLQLVTIAGRAQLFLIPPARDTNDARAPAKATSLAATAKPNLDALVPGRAVTATVVRAAPRSDAPSAQQGGRAPIQAAALAGAERAAPAGEMPASAEEMPAAGASLPAEPAGEAAPPIPATPSAAAAAAPATPSLPAGARATPGVALPAQPNAPAAITTPTETATLPASNAGQAFAGMAPGQQLTLTVLSVVTKTADAGDGASAAADKAAPAAASSEQAAAPAAQSAKAVLATGAKPAAAGSTPAAPARAAGTAPLATLPDAAPAQAGAKPATVGAPPAQAPSAGPAAPNVAQAMPSAPVAAAPQAAAPLAEAITVATSVVGSDVAGQPIVEAGSVLLLLEAKAPPVGSEIVLALPRGQADAAPAPSTASEFAPLEEAARSATAQGGALQQALNTLLPRPGPALAAQLALYVGALRQGQASSWLGNAALDQLEKTGKKSTSQRLAAAFAEAAQTNSAAQRAGGWLGFTLPLVQAGVIAPIHFYVHRRPEDEEKNQDKPETEQGRRFLIDFTLTRLGGIQLDGMARAARLDLIVRTALPMPAELRGELDRLFANVTSARGLGGALIFQVAPPVTPPVARPVAQPQAGGILV